MLTLQSTDAIRRIEAAIGYTFRDKRLLVQVFTRKTYMKVDPEAPDNEVLEFYGDMLMSYHVTTYFIEKFAHMLDDGLYFMRTVEQFTEMRSHYVRNQYLTERIKLLIPSIERLVRAQNPRLELPKDNQKAYADLFESLIGAVYLDSYRDDALIRAFILRHLNIEPKDSPAPNADRARRAVTVLPSVSLPMEDEDRVAVEEEFLADAASHTDTDAAEMPSLPQDDLSVLAEADPSFVENVVAETAVDMIEAPASLPPTEMKEHAEPRPAQEALEAFCRDAGYEAPIYGEAPKNAPNARPVAACTVRFRNGRGKPVKISLNDSGKTIGEATERAAAKMLKKLTDSRAAEEKVKIPPSDEPKTTDEMPMPIEAKEATETVSAPIEVSEATAAVGSAEAVEAVETVESPIDPLPQAVPEAPAESTPAPDEQMPTGEAERPAAETISQESLTDTASEAAANEAAEANSAPVSEPVPAPVRKTQRKRTSTPKNDAKTAPETAAEKPASAEKKPPRSRAAKKKAETADAPAAVAESPVLPAELPSPDDLPHASKPKRRPSSRSKKSDGKDAEA